MVKAKLDARKIRTHAIDNYGSIMAFANAIGVSKSRLYAFVNQEQDPGANIWSSIVGYFGDNIAHYLIFFDYESPKKGKERSNES